MNADEDILLQRALRAEGNLAAIRQLTLDLASRLARRIRNEKHGPECSECQADKELVVMARQALTHG